MVKRCAYGLCRSDDRYKDRVEGVTFHPFPKPKTKLEKCLRWIKLCNRPHAQLNVNKITKNTYVCSKHFPDKSGPSSSYPDPLPHGVSSLPRPARPLPTRRKLNSTVPRMQTKIASAAAANQGVREEDQQLHVTSGKNQMFISSSIQQGTQTENSWIEPLDMLELAVENKTLQEQQTKSETQLQEVARAYNDLYNKASVKQKSVTTQYASGTGFNVNTLMQDDIQFKYYTGFTPEQFRSIYLFLVPDEKLVPFQIPSNRINQVMYLSLKDQLFLTVLKLRHDFHYADIGYRYGISKQTVSIIFTLWVNYMYLRFGEVSIWPSREVLLNNMPDKYIKEFPTTFAILDCTEIKISKPSSLKAQSQTYSDYKSCNTLKGLVACDPRGSIIYTSVLFSGGISDKDIFSKSGFREMLLHLIDIGYLRKGDGLMADKGFNIVSEVEKCGLKLNIPPFAKQGQQMSQSDSLLTKKIACHRVHVERAIQRIKRFKILAGKVPISLYTLINQIWYVCAFLTNFFLPCIQDTC